MIITISRQYATNGILIGRQVAEKFGCPVYDRELIEEIARQMQLHPSDLAYLTRAATNPVHSLLLEWRSSLTPESYSRHLRTALQAIVQQGDAVIVGGGASFALRNAHTLHVRIVAPIQLRSAIFRAGNELTDAEARQIITRRDQERVKFARTVFHADIDDPRQYDLVINLQRVLPEVAADMIVGAARHMQPTGTAPDATMPQHLQMMINARHHVRPEIVERQHHTDPIGEHIHA